MANISSLLEDVDFNQISTDLQKIVRFMLRNYDGETIKASYIETVEHTRDIIVNLPQIISSDNFNQDKQKLLVTNIVFVHQTLMSVSDDFDFESSSTDVTSSMKRLLRSFSSFYPLLIIANTKDD